MSEAELQAQIDALRADLATLRWELRHNNFDWLGPRPPSPETPEEIKARADRIFGDVARQLEKDVPPVDRSKLCTTSGEPPEKVRAEQTEDTGQHKSYIVLCDDERHRGFVRPYRDTYKHLPCGTTTNMGRALSETYARDPTFYGATFCVKCNAHFPVDQFVWAGTTERVGS